MANNFIQETVSREILVAQRNNSVIRQFCATKYEGDIQGKGTSVIVNILIPAVLKDTATNPVSRAADQLDSSTVTITVTEDKNYKFEIEHKDVAEGMPTGMFSETLVDMGVQIARDADKLVLSKYTEITDAEHIVSSKTLDKTNIYDYLIDLDTMMDELEIPQVGRVVVLPPRVAAYLAKDTIIRTAQEQDMPLGYITKVGNLTIVKSNDVQIKTVGEISNFQCLAFVAGKTFAHVNGFNENKVVESAVITDGFKDIAMGQICSGAKLVMPKYAVLFEVLNY